MKWIFVETIDNINKNEVVDYEDISEDASAIDDHNYVKVPVPPATINTLKAQTSILTNRIRYSVIIFAFNGNLTTNLCFVQISSLL